MSEYKFTYNKSANFVRIRQDALSVALECGPEMAEFLRELTEKANALAAKTAELEQEKIRSVPYAVLVNENELLTTDLAAAQKRIEEADEAMISARDDSDFLQIHTWLRKEEI